MAFPSYTYTFSNGTTADASQVNQNFTDILNGVSDTTKDLSVSAITAGGAATLNGNVTLGNGSAKTITVSGSLSSSFPIATNTTYDFGSATLGLRAVYIGGTSTFTTAIKSAATATWSLTLPVGSGTAGYVLTTDGSGNTSWFQNQGVSIVSRTSIYTVASTDDVIKCDASGGAFTVTLPDATVAANKKVFRIVKTDTSLLAVTINTTSAQTISSVASGTFKLSNQNQSLEVYSDGANWQGVNNKRTPTIQSFLSGSGTYTTPAGATYIRVRLVGGGGGGGGSGAGLGNGGVGGDSSFGTTLLSAIGGGVGGTGNSAGGTGGTASLGSGPVGLAVSGGRGGSGNGGISGGSSVGASGGNSALGGGGSGGQSGSNAGTAGATNTGGGGGGASAAASTASAAGGGAGGFVDAIITNPLATYAYVVGAAGAAGAGAVAGGAGGSGVCIVEEFYT